MNGAIKSLFKRHRPVWEEDRPRPHRIRRPATSSFPSGHASAAFTAAGVLSEGDPLWPIYYGLAVVVASSRVYVKMHHASDVIAGGGHRHRRRRHRPPGVAGALVTDPPVLLPFGAWQRALYDPERCATSGG